MTDHYTDFPFTEIRQPSGDYFDNVQQALDAGYALTQIWSVVESDGAYSYGPVGHVVNLLGYIATAEHHDGETYYHEEPDEDYYSCAECMGDGCDECESEGVEPGSMWVKCGICSQDTPPYSACPNPDCFNNEDFPYNFYKPEDVLIHVIGSPRPDQPYGCEWPRFHITHTLIISGDGDGAASYEKKEVEFLEMSLEGAVEEPKYPGFYVVEGVVGICSVGCTRKHEDNITFKFTGFREATFQEIGLLCAE